jgi:MFS family permease
MAAHLSNLNQQFSFGFLLRIFVPFAAGYFLSYLFRVVNTIIATDLSGDLDLDANQLGMLTSVYLIAFAATQLPLGILLDKYGPRQTEAILLLFAAAGAAIFASAETSTGLLVGRALIGFGVSACLMASFKAFVQWFPMERLPMVNGFLLAAGGFGALTAATPVEFALQFTDWRGVFWALAVLTFLVSVAVFFIVPDKPIAQTGTTLKQHIAGIGEVFKSRTFWGIAPWAVASQATAGSVLGLWSGPWLRDVANVGRDDVATTLSLIAVGLILGFALIGSIAEWLRPMGIKPITVGIAGMTIYMFIQLALVLEFTEYSKPLWSAYAFFSTSGVITYAVLSQSFRTELAGRVNTGLNLLVFVMAFVMQWGVGYIINLYVSDRPDQYNTDGFQMAFSVLIVVQVVAMFWYLVSRKKAG